MEFQDFLKSILYWLMATIYFETARTMSPSITNKIGFIGLIQFTVTKQRVNYKTIEQF
jgi:hypothetical protein